MFKTIIVANKYMGDDCRAIADCADIAYALCGKYCRLIGYIFPLFGIAIFATY